MGTRYGDAALSRDWLYPDDGDGFLQTIGTSRDDSREARTRVKLFMLTHGGNGCRKRSGWNLSLSNCCATKLRRGRRGISGELPLSETDRRRLHRRRKH